MLNLESCISSQIVFTVSIEEVELLQLARNFHTKTWQVIKNKNNIIPDTKKKKFTLDIAAPSNTAWNTEETKF